MQAKRKKHKFHHGDLKVSSIAAATNLIAKKANAEFTIREIAKAVGVSHVALFNHFEDKSTLLAEIAKNGFKGLIQAMGNNIKPSVLSCAEAYLNFAISHPGEFRAMFNQSLKPFSKYQGLSEIALRSFQVLTNEVKKEMPNAPAELSLAIWGAVHGIATLEVDGQFTDSIVGTNSSRASLAQRTLELTIKALLEK
jgi:AcrR family transcriptional regulator